MSDNRAVVVDPDAPGSPRAAPARAPPFLRPTAPSTLLWASLGLC